MYFFFSFSPISGPRATPRQSDSLTEFSFYYSWLWPFIPLSLAHTEDLWVSNCTLTFAGGGCLSTEMTSHSCLIIWTDILSDCTQGFEGKWPWIFAKKFSRVIMMWWQELQDTKYLQSQRSLLSWVRESATAYRAWLALLLRLRWGFLVEKIVLVTILGPRSRRTKHSPASLVGLKSYWIRLFAYDSWFSVFLSFMGVVESHESEPICARAGFEDTCRPTLLVDNLKEIWTYGPLVDHKLRVRDNR